MNSHIQYGICRVGSRTQSYSSEPCISPTCQHAQDLDRRMSFYMTICTTGIEPVQKHQCTNLSYYHDMIKNIYHNVQYFFCYILSHEHSKLYCRNRTYISAPAYIFFELKIKESTSKHSLGVEPKQNTYVMKIMQLIYLHLQSKKYCRRYSMYFAPCCVSIYNMYFLPKSLKEIKCQLLIKSQHTSYSLIVKLFINLETIKLSF